MEIATHQPGGERPERGASMFMSLPAELRNRIYELAVVDQAEHYNLFGLQPIILYRKATADYQASHGLPNWKHAHKRRPYMGLAQMCRLIRREFRPLYLKALRFHPYPENAYHLDSLLAFGPIKGAIKADFVAFRHDPLSFGRFDITLMLKILVASEAYMRLSWDWSRKLHEWDIITVVVVLFHYFRHNGCVPGNGGIKTIWLKARSDNDIAPQPTMVFELDLQFVRNLQEKERYNYMRDTILRMELYRLCSAFVEFHCGEWESEWQCAALGSGFPDATDELSRRCRELFTAGELA